MRVYSMAILNNLYLGFFLFFVLFCFVLFCFVLASVYTLSLSSLAEDDLSWLNS